MVNPKPKLKKIQTCLLYYSNNMDDVMSLCSALFFVIAAKPNFGRVRDQLGGLRRKLGSFEIFWV